MLSLNIYTSIFTLNVTANIKPQYQISLSKTLIAHKFKYARYTYSQIWLCAKHYLSFISMNELRPSPQSVYSLQSYKLIV